ncbi:MAG: hypothetical protein ACRCS8_04915 [Brevinema sp.]
MKKWILIFLAMPAMMFSNVPNDPKAVVNYAIKALMSGKVEQLIPITENAELRKTKEIVDSIKDKTFSRDNLLEQYRLVESWKIETVEEHQINGRNLTIVNTVWKMKVKASKKPLPNEVVVPNSQQDKIQTIYVSYMLEKFDNQWKIISQKPGR